MRLLKPKVSIIGAGDVGSTFAFSLMISGLAREIVLIDSNEKKAIGEAMDLNHGISLAQPARIRSGGYQDCAGSDLVVITAGIRQKPGQTRLELVQANVELFKEIVPSIIQHTQEAVLLVVTNPVDILTYVTWKISGFPAHQVLGSGTVLDTSRFRYLMSEFCEVDARNVHAYIIGEHGDTELPVWSNANIGGMKIAAYCPTCQKFNTCGRQKSLEKIFEEVKNSAYKIVEAKGSTYYAIAMALVKITEAILRDQNSILPVSTLMKNYCGIHDVFLSMPSFVNKKGVEKLLEVELSPEEQLQLKKSAAALKKVIETIKF